MSEIPDMVRELLARTRTRLRGALVATAGGRWLAALLAALAAAFVVDWLAIARITEDGPGDLPARALLLALLAGLVLWRLWRGPLAELRRRWDDDAVARAVEAHHPGLGGRLLSGVQLARELDRADALASPDLARAAIARLPALLGAADPARVVDRRALRRALAGAGIALAAVAAAVLWQPGHARAFLRRLALGEAAYPTATRITAFAAPAVAARGEPLSFTVAVDAAGAVPDEAVVEAEEGGRRFTVRLRRTDEGGAPGTVAFTGTLPQPLADLRVRARAGDARWPQWQAVRVGGRPVVAALTATIDYPPYLGRRSDVLAMRDLRLPEGARLALAVRFSNPVATAALVRTAGAESLPPLVVALADDGLAGTVALVPERGGRLAVSCTGRDGLAGAEAVAYAIAIEPDRAPTVALTFPAGDRAISRQARWPLRFTAADDHGFAGAALRLQIERRGGDAAAPEERTLPLAAPAGAGGAGEAQLDAPALRLDEGDRVTAWIEVRDNRPAGAQTAASRRVVFSVLALEALQERFRQERDEAAAQVRKLPERQGELGAAIERLKKEAP